MKFFTLLYCAALVSTFAIAQSSINSSSAPVRQRISINEGWYFYKYDSSATVDNLCYDVRPDVGHNTENRVADAKPTEAVKVETMLEVLKPWILPSANRFIKNPENHHIRPTGNPGNNFQFLKNDYDDSAWKKINLPHDWAINGPFMTGANPNVGGGMGRLPSPGIAWYRKKLNISTADKDKSIFLDIDGAMSYAIVWLNGNLVGGWPYGYNSWRLDLTPYVVPGGENQLAIRLDNPNYAARWYPGAGIYRNVWLTKTDPVHVGQWGTYVTAKDVTKKSVTIDIRITVDNDHKTNTNVSITTRIYELDARDNKTAKAIGNFSSAAATITAESSVTIQQSFAIKNPKLWGPPPTQNPNRYVAVTTLMQNGKPIDVYETRFGVRSIDYNAEKGLLVNGEHVVMKGVNQHHDLGALGAAFNGRAAERQLVMLREMGCNAIRMSHNPPAPELLELTDRMGFLVIDEIFDSWQLKKTPHDFHLIFDDWSEPDTRAFIRRDRNCPSVIMWSFGNEVGEQYTDNDGAAVARRLYNIVKEEDPTRPTTLAMNYAKPGMALPAVPDVISLNYQGEGIRQAAEFEGTDRIRTKPQYDSFHAKFPTKFILSSETASAFSSRGIYLFPVSQEVSAPVRDGRGGDSNTRHVSSYELHAVDFGSSADKVFESLERHPFVGGEFVWTGWDHLGEPTPYYESRSSYCGIIDMAGFKKDRYYLYQSQWLPEFPMVHILPHWNWSERIGEITPVHVFTSGNEAELFLNGKSLGRKKKERYHYRLRWDSVTYQPGELKVVAYKDGKQWAETFVKTTDAPAKLEASSDRNDINADGKDLAFITIKITDKNGYTVPRANHLIDFSIEGPGEIVATDNGDPTNMVSFSSNKREAFNGLCLVIVRSIRGQHGVIKLKATSGSLQVATVVIQSNARN